MNLEFCGNLSEQVDFLDSISFRARHEAALRRSGAGAGVVLFHVLSGRCGRARYDPRAIMFSFSLNPRPFSELCQTMLRPDISAALRRRIVVIILLCCILYCRLCSRQRNDYSII